MSPPSVRRPVAEGAGCLVESSYQIGGVLTGDTSKCDDAPKAPGRSASDVIDAPMVGSMARCLVGCGSNLGPRRDLLDRAIELLRFMPGVRVLQTSRFLESKAVGGPADQPAFLNAACLLETDLPPRDLLGTLQAVENTLDRQRDVRWGPRTIDLDLLLYDNLEIDHEDLTVPHPRMTTRRFVLAPCAEIAPDFLHPPTGCSVRDLLENISPTHRRIAICGVPGSGAAEVSATLADATLGRMIHGGSGLARTIHHHEADHTLDAAVDLASHWHGQLTSVVEDTASCTSVSDFLVGSLSALWNAAGHDIRDDRSQRLEQLVASLPPPHVLILPQVSATALGERIRFCRGPFAGGSDIFADLLACLQAADTAAGGNATPAASDACCIDRLLAFQSQIEAFLACPPSTSCSLPIPKAVLRINADDLGEAADEALAAVEAMA